MSGVFQKTSINILRDLGTRGKAGALPSAWLIEVGPGLMMSLYFIMAGLDKAVGNPMLLYLMTQLNSSSIIEWGQ